MRRRVGLLILVAVTLATRPWHAQSTRTLTPAAADAIAARVTNAAAFKDASAFLDRDHDRLVSEIIHLTEIPAPPFGEDARGKAFLEMLRASGLTDVERDAEGNVMGVRKGAGGGPLICLAAHLDTVFPAGTDVHVKRSGTRLSAPGVGDDARSLAVLLTIIRAMDAAHVATSGDILFVGDVGEEGTGDLRGMKYLFQKGRYRDRITMFVSIDDSGAGDVITRGAVGSKRYHVTFKGPGGHSYSAFGLVSPAFAMGHAIDAFSKLQVPDTPKTTFSVGVLGGGTSVNAIPFETWMDIDLRSESRAALDMLDRAAGAVMREAADAENRARSTAEGRIAVDLKPIGDRPSGETPEDSRIVQLAAAVARASRLTPTFVFGSTDANIPISLGIPAITIRSGGTGDRMHSLDEWIDVEKTASLVGVRAALALVLSLAGIQ